MKRSNFLTVFFASLFVMGIIGLFSCEPKKEPCEEHNTGGVVFWNYGPSWTWPEMYIDIYWADGSSDGSYLTTSVEFYNEPAGRADVDCVWEDADNYYYDSGYVTLKQCQMVEANLTLGKKSVATGEYTSTKQGQANKKDFGSRNEFIQSLKTK